MDAAEASGIVAPESSLAAAWPAVASQAPLTVPETEWLKEPASRALPLALVLFPGSPEWRALPAAAWYPDPDERPEAMAGLPVHPFLDGWAASAVPTRPPVPRQKSSQT